MSTKIYRAYVINDGVGLWDFVHCLRIEATKRIRAKLKEIYMSWDMNKAREQQEFQDILSQYEDNKNRDQIALVEYAERVLIREYKKQSSSHVRNIFDMDVSVAFRQHNGRIYLIPYCDMMMRDVLDFLDDSEKVSDFAYWNNTDRPEEITDEEWDHRRDIWNELLDEEKEWDMLVIELLCPGNFYRIDPWLEITKDLYNKGK